MRRLVTCLAILVLVACDGAGTPDAAVDAGSDAGVEPLRAEAGPSFYAVVGEETSLDGSGSTGAVGFVWDFGDGRGWDAPRAEAVARVTYAAEGRYRAFLTVEDESGRTDVDSVLVNVVHPAVHLPRASGSVAVWSERSEVAVVSPDSDELAIFAHDEGGALALVRRVDTGTDPRTVTIHDSRWAVVCQDGAEVDLVDPDGTLTAVPMPYASRPFGAVSVAGALFVTLQALGEVARIESEAVTARFFAIDDARGIAALPDDRILVSRWRSPSDQGQMVALSSDGTSVEPWSLAYDPQPGSDTESGGVPSYLSSVAVSPTGRAAAVPSLQASIGEGLFVSPRPLTLQTSVRAALSYLDPSTGDEDFARRKLFDDRGLASAAVFSGRGDFLYVAMRGSRAIARVDVITGAAAGSVLDVGFAPQGLDVAGDRFLFVDAYLSRELVAYDISNTGLVPAEVSRATIPSNEPLEAELLRGKILFNDSADPRLARDSYIACAHCHLDGLSDRRTWDFTDRGEGLRNTIDLVGRAGMAHGPLHWSANFDEVQDFEHDIRGAFGGLGLMSDTEFHTGTRDQSLGDPKAGVSADLDALAAYVTSLGTHLPSPLRDPDGALPTPAVRGQTLFLGAGCTTCHAGAALTDSGFDGAGLPRLHDVGTLGPGSGARLGGTLAGIDTPTLHGLWQSAPYLHDGSAASLREVLTTRNIGDAHGSTSALSAGEIDDLVAYLRCLDGRID